MRKFLYKALKYSNDMSAIKRGKVGKRIARRTAGKAAGKTFRRLFK